MTTIESCKNRASSLLARADKIMDSETPDDLLPIKEYQKAIEMYREAATIMMTLRACTEEAIKKMGKDNYVK